jgi:hypothetical protein
MLNAQFSMFNIQYSIFIVHFTIANNYKLKIQNADAHDASGQCPDTFYFVGTCGQNTDIYRRHSKLFTNDINVVSIHY